ncbi:MAG TPA: hypothetical protein DEQ87_17330 [Algoriphagus sp.]|jgi:hypothetical protein|nr:hypothetical protein [Algoriphagus sp.]MAN85937.1 hypothetical protein [Algoriphagus sp.]HAD52017.1 hypothetical protein [Algoriphagus sp.]HAH38221.1 hypothetical protein [Algoriphagus sp.]HAS58953.1 hypothetical protein [Algoriphagus sp.]|tara:strand:+ start:7395 stop:7976 length:582 start_codon:yes stop_codon:yes gene_type:complete
MHNVRKLILVFVCLIPVLGFSQEKIEREKRVDEKEVPKAAIEWLYDAFEEIKKPKWYQEFFESGYSFEAKFFKDGRYFSVEFDSLGIIQDVEIEMPLDEILPEVQKNLTAYWEETYSDFKLIKIQRQYSGDPDDLEDFFDENEVENILERYEIEYIGKEKDGVEQIWEATFDAQGKFISKRVVVVRIMDNLIF